MTDFRISYSNTNPVLNSSAKLQSTAKLGSHTIAITGNPPLNLAKLDTRSIPFQGFKNVTRINKSNIGLYQRVNDTISTLTMPGDNVNIALFARTLNTVQNYLNRQVKLGLLTNAQMDDKFMAMFAPNIQRMDNEKLNALYQSLTSLAMDDLRDGLLKEFAQNTLSAAKLSELKALYANICNLEALVVQEVSIRTNVASMSPLEASQYKSLSERHEDPQSNATLINSPLVPQESVSEPDSSGMSLSNLALMVGKQASNSIDAPKINQQTQQVLQKHNIDPTAPTKFGDMLRQSEMTINFSISCLLGYDEGQDPDHAPIEDPNFQLKNIFQLKQGTDDIDSKTKHYLNMRTQTEGMLFSTATTNNSSGEERPIYGNSSRDERPIYAALNTGKVAGGGAKDYGDAVIVLKPEIKRKATYTLNDSFRTVPVKVTDANTKKFFDELTKLPEISAQDKKKLLDTNPPSELRTAVMNEINFLKKCIKPTMENFTTLSNLICTDVISVATGKKLDISQLSHLIEKCFVDRDRLANCTATFDHIENLMTEMTEPGTLFYAQAGIDHFNNPNTGTLHFAGSPYIEAQIHGSVELGRDVEEIRIDRLALEHTIHIDMRIHPERYEKEMQELRAANPELRITEIKTLLSEKKAQEKLELLENKCKRIGIQLTAISNEDAHIHGNEQTHSHELYQKVADTMRPELQKVMDKLKKPENEQELLKQSLKQIDTHSPKLTARWGKNLEKLPQKFKAFVLAPTQTDISKASEFQNMTNEAVLTLAIQKKCSERLFKLLQMMEQLDSLEHHSILAFADEKSKQDYLDFVVSQPSFKDCPNSNFPTVLPYLKDLLDSRSLAMENCGKLLNNKVLTSIEGYNDSIKEMLGDKPIVEGAAAKALQGTCLNVIQKNLDAFNKGNFNLSPAELTDNLKNNDSIKKMLETKINLLNTIQKDYNFNSPEDRDSFVGWILNSRAIKSPVEMKVIFDASNNLIDSIKTFKAQGTPITPMQYMALYSSMYQSFTNSAAELLKVHHMEMGPDDTQANVSRVISVALGRLLATHVFDTPEELENSIKTPSVKHFQTSQNSLLRFVLANENSNPNDSLTKERDFLFFLNTFQLSIDETMDRLAPLPNNKKRDLVNMPLESIGQKDREFIKNFVPNTMKIIEAKCPFNPQTVRSVEHIAPPIHPDRLPQTLADREQFLLELLPEYHQHEKTFDRGTNYHGRAHATRAFVMANIMGNILKERGIHVDMNALSLGIAGHDIGRSNNGRDTEEKKSADKTLEMIEKLYSGAGGDNWKSGIANGINHGEHIPPKTLEGYLLVCADSLDYERIDEIDEKYFPFLQVPLETSEGYTPVDKNLRQELILESKLLTRMTDPGSNYSPRIKEIMTKILDPDVTTTEKVQLSQEMKSLREQTYLGQIEQTEKLSNQDILTLVKNSIALNPKDFPLFSKYYV